MFWKPNRYGTPPTGIYEIGDVGPVMSPMIVLSDDASDDDAVVVVVADVVVELDDARPCKAWGTAEITWDNVVCALAPDNALTAWVTAAD
jgi:hypothetical protein